MTMRIHNEDSYLIFDEDTEIVYLKPELFHEAGTCSDAMIIFKMDQEPQLAFNVIIEATIDRCISNVARFEIRAYVIAYPIGDDDFKYKLPKVI